MTGTSWPRCHILLYIGGPFEQTICPRPAPIATNSPHRGGHDMMGISSPKRHVYKKIFSTLLSALPQRDIAQSALCVIRF